MLEWIWSRWTDQFEMIPALKDGVITPGVSLGTLAGTVSISVPCRAANFGCSLL